MHISTTAANPWPSNFAYLAALIFIGASGAINVTYGWQKGTDLASSLVWASVAGAVAIVFALSLPALIRCADTRQWSAAAVALIAMILAGSYSITAALGSAAGGRMSAATAESDTAGARQRAQTAYNAGTAELARLEPSRSVDELVPLVDAARPQCRVRVDGSGRQTVCAKPSSLLAELGRANRRAELQAQIDKASTALSAGSARPANTDAKALQRYLAAMGLNVTADRLNDLLTILAVVMIEAGGGLSLALGLALTPPGAPESRAAAGVSGETGQPGQTVRPVPGSAPDTAVRVRPAGSSTPAVAPETGADVLAWLQKQGGCVVGLRPMAEALGRPRSTLSDQLRRLAGHGRITLTPGRRGLVIELAGQPN